ncbi:glyoxalase [Pseudonocardia sulfidoxydans NBRC 16205]|uniref:Glyoxalase n=2 Tax=Pseudonocardia sulfidoxydans TaxID=54011 RepID=A0A511D987_9PSEU|nr:VOC family protein [Pseudonocardia sulfidoxydans]GEL21336.1 glyoxalase [Pseudonocardia sulfidoxydans NBRC 16205]
MSISARLDVIGIITADMAAALAFYRMLGVDVPAGADGEPHVEASLPGGLRLAFDTEATIGSFVPGFTPPAPGGRIGLAFLLDDPAAVDAAYAELTAAGHHGELAPFDAFWGQRYATVQDPDGNGVDLFAPLPAEARTP